MLSAECVPWEADISTISARSAISASPGGIRRCLVRYWGRLLIVVKPHLPYHFALLCSGFSGWTVLQSGIPRRNQELAPGKQVQCPNDSIQEIGFRSLRPLARSPRACPHLHYHQQATQERCQGSRESAHAAAAGSPSPQARRGATSGVAPLAPPLRALYHQLLCGRHH